MLFCQSDKHGSSPYFSDAILAGFFYIVLMNAVIDDSTLHGQSANAQHGKVLSSIQIRLFPKSILSFLRTTNQKWLGMVNVTKQGNGYFGAFGCPQVVKSVKTLSMK
jgi:hypothetical protein